MRKLLLVLLLLCGAAACEARDVVLVLLNPNTPVPVLNRADIADLFLGRRSFNAGGIALVPVDSRDEGVREQFYQSIAGMSSNRVHAYGARRVFSSQGRPPREVAAAQAAAMLMRETGTLIYVFSDQLPAGARVLLDLGEANRTM